MENRAYRHRRRGNGRPSPVDREREDAVAESRSEQYAEKVHRNRAKFKEIAENARADLNVEVDQFIRLKCHFVVKWLVESIEPHLSRCPGLGSRQAIVERLFGHPSISLHLPSYYLPS